MLGWLLYRSLQLLLAPVPLPVARTVLGRFMLTLAPLLSSQNKRMTRSLRVAFPDRGDTWLEARRRQGWLRLGYTVAEAMKTKAVRASLDTHVTYDAEPERSEAAADPRGVLMLMSHFGAWEVAIQMASRLGKPVLGLYRPLANPRIDAEIAKARTANALSMLPITSPATLRKAVKHVKNGGYLALFVDQRWRGGELMELFGEPALTTLSPGLFATATECRINTLFCTRDGKDRHKVELKSLDVGTLPSDRLEAGRSIMAAFNARLEEKVRAHPDDWFWMQDRWKP